MVTRIPDVTVAIDFMSEVPHMANLPLDMFDINESQALATAAALFCAPELRVEHDLLTTDGALAVRILALFGADAWVRFSRPDFEELYARATQFQRECEDPETAETVRWVLRRAHARACWIGLAHNHTQPLSDAQSPLALVDPYEGRGYGIIDRGLASEFHGAVPSRSAPLVTGTSKSTEQVEWERKRLITYAALFAGCETHCCNTSAEAVVFLALYGAGVRVQLTKQQYRKLERRVRDYISTQTSDHGVQRNADMASFVVHAAQERARATGVIGGANDTEVPSGIIERTSPDGRRVLILPDLHVPANHRQAMRQFHEFAARVRKQQG